MPGSKLVFVATVVTVALLGVPVAALAQASALTPMDYVEIRQLVARYLHALDSAGGDGYALADLFAPDGEIAGSDVRGREALAAFATADERRGPAHIAHFGMNHVITPSPEGATGRQYVVGIQFDENPARPAGAPPTGPLDQRTLVGRRGGEIGPVGGRYDDVYVRTPEGWRFASRTFTPSRSGPQPGASAPALSRRPAPAAPVDRSAPATPAAAGTLTAGDFLEIEELVSRYGHALDSGFNTDDNGEAYASLFTPDGTFYSRGRPFQGPEALAELARAQPNGPRYVRHFLANHVIEPTPDGAVGREYLVVIDIGKNGSPSTVFLGGYYEDEYARTPAGWRFRTRRSFGARAGR